MLEAQQQQGGVDTQAFQVVDNDADQLKTRAEKIREGRSRKAGEVAVKMIDGAMSRAEAGSKVYDSIKTQVKKVAEAADLAIDTAFRAVGALPEGIAGLVAYVADTSEKAIVEARAWMAEQDDRIADAVGQKMDSIAQSIDSNIKAFLANRKEKAAARLEKQAQRDEARATGKIEKMKKITNRIDQRAQTRVDSIEDKIKKLRAQQKKIKANADSQIDQRKNDFEIKADLLTNDAESKRAAAKIAETEAENLKDEAEEAQKNTSLLGGLRKRIRSLIAG